MEAGDPGVLILNAARLVVEDIRREPESAITQHLYMEEPSVQDHPIRQKAATLKPVQWMEVGDPGVHTLPAARLVVGDIRREPDSAITQHLYMEGLSVQDHPIR